MTPLDTPFTKIAKHAAHAASVLKLMANEQRLLILCRLIQDEFSVGQMTAADRSLFPVSTYVTKLML